MLESVIAAAAGGRDFAVVDFIDDERHGQEVTSWNIELLRCEGTSPRYAILSSSYSQHYIQSSRVCTHVSAILCLYTCLCHIMSVHVCVDHVRDLCDKVGLTGYRFHNALFGSTYTAAGRGLG